MVSDATNKYLQWLEKNYEGQKKKLQSYCLSSGITWDEDVYSDTALKIYEKIDKKGMIDTSDKGFENYLFKAFKTNILRERQYARNALNDDNYDGEVEQIYDDWYNRENDAEIEKLKKDLWIDYSTLYLLHKVEEHFDDEHCYVFRMKYLMPKMTYKKLGKKTDIKNIRQKVADVKHWLQDNVSKEEIKKAFINKYGNILN